MRRADYEAGDFVGRPHAIAVAAHAPLADLSMVQGA